MALGVCWGSVHAGAQPGGGGPGGTHPWEVWQPEGQLCVPAPPASHGASPPPPRAAIGWRPSAKMGFASFLICFTSF